MEEKNLLQSLVALKIIQEKGLEKEYVAGLIAELENALSQNSKTSDPEPFADISEITVFVDGGSRGNPGPSGCSCIIKIGDKTIRANKFLGLGTNNEAEYSGVLLALQKLKEKNITSKKVKFFADSQLTMKQLAGEWRIKDPRMQNFANQIHSLIRELNLEAEFINIPREQNAEADRLTNNAMDGIIINE